MWDPHTKCLQEELEKVQNRAARFVTRNYTFEEGSMTGILDSGGFRGGSRGSLEPPSGPKLFHFHGIF